MAQVPVSVSAASTGQPHPSREPGRQLKARLRAGEVLVGGTLMEFARPSLVRVYSEAGFDFLMLENEHMLFSPAAIADTVAAARSCGLPVISKIPQLERGETTRLLDCGVVGIQLPRTETREQVETLRSFIKFPPHGTRAAAPGLGNSDFRQPTDLKKWLADQDAETILVAHIETRKAFENAEEIITTPGVDMVYLGPGDFTIEMGHPGEPNHPEVSGPMEKILELCKRHKVPFGTTAYSTEAAAGWIAKGAQFFEARSELSMIYQSASQLVRDYQKLKPESAKR